MCIDISGGITDVQILEFSCVVALFTDLSRVLMHFKKANFTHLARKFDLALVISNENTSRRNSVAWCKISVSSF